MPVTRFRELEDARTALEAGPRSSLATFLALRNFAARVRAAGTESDARPSSRGVRRFRTLEEAQEDRLHTSS